VAELLNVPFNHQKAHGYCLPACAQMALAYLGIARSQEELARTLGDDLRYWLEQKAPIIAFVHTGLLAYWQGQVAQHAVIIVGIDEQTVYLLDSAKTENAVAVLLDEFLLAWDEMEFAFAVITS
jgi:hypothetical protein